MKEKIQIQKIDMLHGSIWDKLLFYAVPVAATGILEQLFNASDIAIVGNFANENRTAAVAAVGANSPIIGLILNLFIGIALGTNVVIANAIGEKNEKTISKVVNTSIIMAVLMVFSAYIFSMIYENMSGYLSGFGISLVPAILTVIGVCLVRIIWIYAVFPVYKTFNTIMLAYPLSLSVTAILIFISLIIYKPSHRFADNVLKQRRIYL